MKEIISSCHRSKLIYEEPHIIKQQYPNMKQYNKKAFLTYTDKIHITFRGTKEFKDIIENIDIRHQSIIHDDIKVHKGYHDQFFSMEEEITQDIKDIINSYEINEIIFSGHSSGGSMSQIAATFYGELLKRNIICHTFGTIAPGNKAFIEWFKKNVFKNYRIETEGDIIPFIPVHDNFYHVPNGIKLLKNGGIESNYHIKPYSYLELLKVVLDNEKMQQIYEYHSCDNYIKKLENINIVDRFNIIANQKWITF
jgi:hypothetical protein